MLSLPKYYLPIFLLVYLLITFIIPSVRVYKQTGIKPLTFGSSDNAHDYIGTIMKVLIGFLAIAIILFSFSTGGYQYLSPINYLHFEWLQIVGFSITHLSMVWIVIAQKQMKELWRIGIDKKN